MTTAVSPAAPWNGLLSSAILYWIYVVTVTYGHAPVLVGVLAPVALAVYIALFPAAVLLLLERALIGARLRRIP